MRLKQNVIYQKVCESLEKDRVYLRPSLSLSELSVIVGTNTTYLSNTINTCFGRNFRTLINDFRIGYAVSLFLREGGTTRVKGLHARCGYTSVSIFYEAFTQRLGTSPMRLARGLRAGGAAALPPAYAEQYRTILSILHSQPLAAVNTHTENNPFY